MTDGSAVVLDNTVLTNLALAGRTDLVFRLWPEAACTTPTVLGEYRAGAAGGIVPRDSWSQLAVTALRSEEKTMLTRLPHRLDPGEKSCLAVAYCRRGALVTDDLDARRVAADLGVRISGTVGILIACVKQGILALAEANRLLGIMIELGYHSPIDSLEATI